MSEMVVIASGVPCHECGILINESADKPVVFFDEIQDRDVVFHEACLDMEHRVALLVHTVCAAS